MNRSTGFCHLRVVDCDDDSDGHSKRHALFNGQSWYEYYPPSREAFHRVMTTILQSKDETAANQNARVGIVNTLLKEHRFALRLQIDAPIASWIEAYYALYAASAVMIIYSDSLQHKGEKDYEVVRRWELPKALFTPRRR